jgi:hypothetical protein
VTSGHATRVAAQPAVSGAAAASSSITASTAIATRSRKSRHGRKYHEASGNPLHCFHLRFPMFCPNGSIVRTARTCDSGQL